VGLYLDRCSPASTSWPWAIFRIVRDSEVEIEEEAEDLVRLFESALKRRKRGSVIRLSVNAAMPEELLAFVRDELGAAPEDVFVREGLLGLASTARLNHRGGA